MRMRAAIAALSSCGASLVFADYKESQRLDACREVIHDVMGVKESAPRDLIEKAECVAVIPGVKKAAAVVGGRFGYGAVSCRGEGGLGPWGAPLMVSLKGGSLGYQIGGQESDLVLLFMNPKGIDSLLKNKFTLGADVSVSAGPVGRTAEAATDAQMRAEILSYSRSRGLFAGVSLEGAVVKPDAKANFGVYGEHVSARELLTQSGREVPKSARGFVDELNKLAPRPSGWKQ